MFLWIRWAGQRLPIPYDKRMSVSRLTWIVLIIAVAVFSLGALVWTHVNSRPPQTPTQGSAVEKTAPGPDTSLSLPPTPSTSSIPYAPSHLDNGIRTDSIIISFRAEATADDRAKIISKINGTLTFYDPKTRLAGIQIAPRWNGMAVLDLVQQLEKEPLVEFASPDMPFDPQMGAERPS